MAAAYSTFYIRSAYTSEGMCAVPGMLSADTWIDKIFAELRSCNLSTGFSSLLAKRGRSNTVLIARFG